MSIFGKEFYPTPAEVIEKMLKPFKSRVHRGGFNGYEVDGYELKGKYILEPSAGKGDIVDFIDKQFEYVSNPPKMFVIEIEENLQSILREKEYKLIGNDFLSFKTDLLFDLIIMNPPFSNGDEHLLHAFDLLYSGDIICLLNSETINNPYTEKRKLLKSIIEAHGSVEDLGACFDTAERKTGVSVSLVRLHIEPKDDRFKFDFESKGMEGKPDLTEDSVNSEELIVFDMIEGIVVQFGQLQNSFVEYCKVMKKLWLYSDGLLGKYDNVKDLVNKHVSGDVKEAYNDFSNESRALAWNLVITKCGIEKYMTTEAQKSFQKFIQQQGSMPFTKENIYAVIYMIIENSGSLLEKSIEEVFDIFTRYHNENRLHVEGWKTNDSWKVNRKVILPNWCRYGEYYNLYDLKKHGDTFKISYSREYTDIDKALCYITGKDFNMIRSIHWALDNKFNILGRVYPGDKFDNTCESTFFDIKFFRKGTIHITFKDEKLWEEFNIRATHMKNWIPPAEYDEWKMKKNGVDVIKKEMRIENTRTPENCVVEQMTLFK